MPHCVGEGVHDGGFRELVAADQLLISHRRLFKRDFGVEDALVPNLDFSMSGAVNTASASAAIQC